MRELRVQLRFDPEHPIEVGTLAEDGRDVWFAYDDAFLPRGLSISPLRLPLEAGLRRHAPRPGAPIPGVFNDARPDGWGLKLLHRAFQAAGRPVSSVSPLEELAWLGDHTMGALCFHPATGPEGSFDDAVALGAVATHAQRVWDDEVHEVLPELLRLGGPSGGAWPKALIALRDDGGPGVRYGEGHVAPGWSAWLVKFPTSRDDDEVAAREAAWLCMADAAGIDVPPARLLDVQGVGRAFAVRRFDRPSCDRRLHMISAAGALDADFRVTAADYVHLLRATQQICAGDQSQVLAMYRLAAFNVAAENHDDHLKNIAWLMDDQGRYRLAPGFDLTYAPRPFGERWTTVHGAGRQVSRDDLLRLADDAGLRPQDARRILEEVVAATERVEAHLAAHRCGNPVSRAAATAVLAATRRLQG